MARYRPSTGKLRTIKRTVYTTKKPTTQGGDTLVALQLIGSKIYGLLKGAKQGYTLSSLVTPGTPPTATAPKLKGCDDFSFIIGSSKQFSGLCGPPGFEQGRLYPVSVYERTLTQGQPAPLGAVKKTNSSEEISLNRFQWQGSLASQQDSSRSAYGVIVDYKDPNNSKVYKLDTRAFNKAPARAFKVNKTVFYVLNRFFFVAIKQIRFVP